MEDIDLPVISLSQQSLDNPLTRREEAEKLVESFTNLGFCYVTGLGEYDSEELFKSIKWFFNDVPEMEKVRQLSTRTTNKDNSNLYLGYYPLIPDVITHVEQHRMGPAELSDLDFPEEDIIGNPLTEKTPKLNLLGRRSETEKFNEVMDRYFKMFQLAGDTVMSLIAEAGGEGAEFFKTFPTRSMLKAMKYPTRGENVPQLARLPDGRVMIGPPHADNGILTFLDTFGYQGLEIQIDGKWFSVTIKKDSLVLNVGEILTGMSNGRFKSTIHRVVGIGSDRYSMPFFYQPAYNADINFKIPRELLPEGNEFAEESYYPFAALFLKKMTYFPEFANLLTFIPQWMNEKYGGFTGKLSWEDKNIKTDQKTGKKVYVT